MVESGKRRRRLSDGYSFAGFRADETLRGVFGDPDVRILRLDRRSKKRFAAVAGRKRQGPSGWNKGPADWLFFDLNKIGKLTNALDRERCRNAYAQGGNV